MANITRKYFASKLCSLYESFGDTDFDPEVFSADTMQAFLKFSGEDTNTRLCSEIIEFGTLPSNYDPDLTVYGFKVKGKEIFIGHVLNQLEQQTTIPAAVQERFPELTEDEWQAVMCMATMIIQAFSPSKPGSVNG